MFEGSYPPGVTGRMIDERCDHVELPDECQYCTFYEEKTCGKICSILEAEYTAEQTDDMSDEEYMQKFGKQPTDTCNDFERWED